MLGLVGLDTCAPGAQQRSPVLQIVAAVKEDFQHLVTAVEELTVRVAKIETFTSCTTGDGVQAGPGMASLFARVQDLEASSLGAQGTEDKRTRKQEKDWMEGIVDLNSPKGVDIRRCEKFKKTMFELKEEVLYAIEHSISEWQNQMADEIQVCKEVAEANSRDVKKMGSIVDDMASRLEGIDKLQKAEHLSIIKFCLQACTLPPGEIDACIESVGQKEEQLKQSQCGGRTTVQTQMPV